MEIEKICVMGSGLMGSGIAQVCARKGYDVSVRDIEEDLVEEGLESIRSDLQKLADKGKIEEEEVEDTMERIEGTVDMEEAAQDADLVIEAVPEDMGLKKEIYNELEGICPDRTIFASNTSSLMITDMASATERPEKFIGMHWFNPAPVMPLIEIVRGAETSDETYETIRELSEDLGKTPIDAEDAPGFFTTRYINSYLIHAVELFEKGIAGIKEIDEMCKLAFNWPMGPFELMDFVGLDTLMHVSDYIRGETGDPRQVAPTTLRKLVKAGYMGKKLGSKGGFYEYFGVEKE